MCCSTGCVLFYGLCPVFLMLQSTDSVRTCVVLLAVCCSTGCELFYWLRVVLRAMSCVTYVAIY